MRLIAKKQIRYATRMMMPGDVFEARPADAKILIHIRKAALAPLNRAEIAPVPPAIADAVRVDGLEELRAEAEEAGIKVDRRWGVERLRAELAGK